MHNLVALSHSSEMRPNGYHGYHGIIDMAETP